MGRLAGSDGLPGQSSVRRYLTSHSLGALFSSMNIYIEHNKGSGKYEVKEEGNPIPVAEAPTQKEAEEKAAQLYPGVKPDVERVRHTEKGGPDQWRKK
jgi:hypothetical protein